MGINRVAACGLVLVVLAVAGCHDDPVVSTDDLIAQLLQLDAEGALALANDWRTTMPSVNTTLTADAIEFVFADGKQASVPLPADTMVLAVAPYVSETHPCEIHSVNTCPGELVGAEIHVLARAADGTVLIDETMTAMDNGYVELWLPRDSEIDLTLGAEGKTATGRVTTYATSPTCIPDLRLE